MKLLLRFPPDLHETPHTADVILETGARINIDRANVDAVQGEAVIEVPKEKEVQVAALFEQKGVEVRRLWRLIERDEERCVHCGACVSVCPTGVFAFDQSWQVSVEEQKCLRCSVCVKACPLGALACVE